MAKTIVQRIVFKNTTTTAIYDLYMNARKHSLVTGALAKITAKEGTKYSAWDEYITGKNLQLIPNKLIVQSWHARDWEDGTIDSTFILNMEQKGKNVLLYVIHANLPDEHAESISKGWHEHYWDRWKKYLEENSKSKM